MRERRTTKFVTRKLCGINFSSATDGLDLGANCTAGIMNVYINDAREIYLEGARGCKIFSNISPYKFPLGYYTSNMIVRDKIY